MAQVHQLPKAAPRALPDANSQAYFEIMKQYATEKAAWLSGHPNAPLAQIEAAYAAIARRLGL